MKKIVFFLLMMICLFILRPVYSVPDSMTPGRLILVGGVIGGIEAIRGIIKLFSGREEERDMYDDPEGTNVMTSQEIAELEKYELLDKLTAKSRLFDIIEGKDEASMRSKEEIKLLMQEIIERKPKYVRKGILTEEEESMVQAWTQNMAKVQVKTNKLTEETNYKTIKQYSVTPFEAQFDFHYTVTNKITGGVTKEKGINYYEVGKAYYAQGEKEKAKDYFLRTIAQTESHMNERKDIMRVNKGRSIIFLERYYNMPLDKIIEEVKKYEGK